MSNHQRDLLLIMLFPIMSLLLGIGMGWVTVGIKIWQIFESLKFQLGFMSVLLFLIGLGACKYEFNFSFFTKRKYESAFETKDLLQSLGTFLIILCLCGLINGVSQQAILETAIRMIMGGIIFFIPVLMLFICATINKMK